MDSLGTLNSVTAITVRDCEMAIFLVQLNRRTPLPSSPHIFGVRQFFFCKEFVFQTSGMSLYPARGRIRTTFFSFQQTPVAHEQNWLFVGEGLSSDRLIEWYAFFDTELIFIFNFDRTILIFDRAFAILVFDYIGCIRTCFD